MQRSPAVKPFPTISPRMPNSRRLTKFVAACKFRGLEDTCMWQLCLLIIYLHKSVMWWKKKTDKVIYDQVTKFMARCQIWRDGEENPASCEFRSLEVFQHVDYIHCSDWRTLTLAIKLLPTMLPSKRPIWHDGHRKSGILGSWYGYGWPGQSRGFRGRVNAIHHSIRNRKLPLETNFYANRANMKNRFFFLSQCPE